MKFAMGRLMITAGCQAHMARLEEQPVDYVIRHVGGDWGDVKGSDITANEQAIDQNLRILSRYTLRDGSSIYIITEWDRSYTTIMMVDEY